MKIIIPAQEPTQEPTQEPEHIQNQDSEGKMMNDESTETDIVNNNEITSLVEDNVIPDNINAPHQNNHDPRKKRDRKPKNPSKNSLKNS